MKGSVWVAAEAAVTRSPAVTVAAAMIRRAVQVIGRWYRQ